ncbi:Cyclophilin-type peptidyl-prolyl cis-trans isomerase protein [Dioscorea alata]|uniref:Cyclophilin-type peptidyl-prolyl cis-trans isomerase protein n=1 Tax=Dioscorea alata TaxID=55571 RepID=A0ACB7TSD6_DIOAL|nr:Cyclophilin-type peptidyl-prolyl cis-trans isomerase protein [Dioscorea alata]
MSTVYTLEPPTKGKVVLKTTMGPVDIELWPKEAPKAVRNFVQLCLEGYYDRTIFHRVIKSFLIQGGDPTGSGTGGESIYGGAFADEFHTRLRFNHRGLVACANAGSPHSNGSQFFISLDRCDWLDRKNTIFGKVTGDSIYNLLRLGEVEADKDDRPLDPPIILSVEVLWNPFDDIVPRKVSEKPLSHIKTDDGGKALRKKAEKKLNVLSFGEEVEEEEKEVEAAGKEKIKSIHDVLDDPRFVKEEVKRDEPVLNPAEVERKKDIQLSVREALNSRKGDSNKDEGINAPETYDHSGGDDDDDDDGDEAKFDAHMRMQILRRRRELGDISTREKSATGKSGQKERQNSPPRRDAEDEERRKLKVEKLSMKKKGIGSEARSEQLAKADADLQLLNHAEQERQMQKQKKRRLHGREEDTLARLDKFSKTLSTKLSVPGSSKNSMETDEDNEPGWMTNQLKFIPDSTEKDGMARKDDPNEYVVLDPLLEKGKEKFNRMQAKLKRREREWAGKSLT